MFSEANLKFFFSHIDNTQHQHKNKTKITRFEIVNQFLKPLKCTTSIKFAKNREIDLYCVQSREESRHKWLNNNQNDVICKRIRWFFLSHLEQSGKTSLFENIKRNQFSPVSYDKSSGITQTTYQII